MSPLQLWLYFYCTFHLTLQWLINSFHWYSHSASWHSSTDGKFVYGNQSCAECNATTVEHGSLIVSTNCCSATPFCNMVHRWYLIVWKDFRWVPTPSLCSCNLIALVSMNCWCFKSSTDWSDVLCFPPALALPHSHIMVSFHFPLCPSNKIDKWHKLLLLHSLHWFNKHFLSVERSTGHWALIFEKYWKRESSPETSLLWRFCIWQGGQITITSLSSF